MSLKDEIYDEVAAESTAIIDDARAAFTIEYDRATDEQSRADAVLQWLCRIQVAIESANIRLSALSPGWRGLN